MAQECNDIKTFTATEALENRRRVKLTAASGTAVEYADAGEEFIGITWKAVAIGEQVPVKLRSAGFTCKACAAEAFAAGATLYGANDGKVQDTASGTAQGTALEAATAAGDIVEVYFDNGTGTSAIDSDNLANDDPDEEGSIPVVFHLVSTADCSSTKATVATLKRKMKVIDWWMISRDTTAANITLYNGDTNAMNTALAKGTADNTRVQGATIIDTYQEVAAAGVIKVGASADCDFDVFVMAIPIA